MNQDCIRISILIKGDITCGFCKITVRGRNVIIFWGEKDAIKLFQIIKDTGNKEERA